LKDAGVNAIRSAHNPVAPEFLDLCDRMGLLVLSETFDTWTGRKNNADYGYQRFFDDWWEADTRDTLLRDRNHPSIILVSVGNEIRDDFGGPDGVKRLTGQRDLVHRLAPAMPVTMALFRPTQSRVYENGFAELLDVVGQNYREAELLAAHESQPKRKVVGTETGHSREAWLAMRDHPFMAGQFLWTGVDYLGETDWPKIAHDSGLLDRSGAARVRFYQRQSWWSDKPMVRIARVESPSGGVTGGAADLEIVSNWTPRDPDTYDEAQVEVYSNCEEVELVLNGASLGAKARPADDAPRTWSFPFERGALKALGKNHGQVVATHELRTAGRPARIVLSSESPRLAHDWDGVAYVTAIVVDHEGAQCPWADDLIRFRVEGPGVIAAVDNGDPASHEAYQGSERRAYQGQCVAVIKASAPSGRITVSGFGAGLEGGSVSVEATAPRDR
jgi:beta-galactosidase